MPSVTYTTINPSYQGAIIGDSATTWDGARGATDGSAYNYTTSAEANAAVFINYEINKGQTIWTINRSYLYFDVSSISGTVDSVILKIAGAGQYTSADIIVVASTAFNGTNNALIGTDFDNVSFSTPYSSEVTTWNVNSYNNISLNSAAYSAIESSSVFKVAIIEHDFDYSDVSTTTTPRSGIWFADSTYPIELYVGYVPGGYSNNVNGVSAASIASVNNVSASSIANINGV
jgi:hypothetical protein